MPSAETSAGASNCLDGIETAIVRVDAPVARFSLMQRMFVERDSVRFLIQS